MARQEFLDFNILKAQIHASRNTVKTHSIKATGNYLTVCSWVSNYERLRNKNTGTDPIPSHSTAFNRKVDRKQNNSTFENQPAIRTFSENNALSLSLSLSPSAKSREDTLEVLGFGARSRP